MDATATKDYWIGMIKIKQIDIGDSIFDKMIQAKEDYVLDPIVDCHDKFQKIIEQALGHKIQIRNSWMNRTVFTGTNNAFPWHNEKGVGGQGTVMPGTHAGILWLRGDTDAGGSLGVMDTDGEVGIVAFNPGSLITFPIDYLHKVEHYYGETPRISVNITYERMEN